VSVRATLQPLARGDVEAYVVAPAVGRRQRRHVRFDSGAIDAVTALTGGVPRLINLLVRSGADGGAHAARATIDAGAVHEAGRVLGMTRPRRRAPARARPGTASLWIVVGARVLGSAALRVAAPQP
jgi:hypothetical protein